MDHEENENTHAFDCLKPGSNVIEEDFSCCVCFCLCVQPTTLTCGHTSCRPCLARWYFNSQKKQCPLCCQAYQGHPMINAHFRSMISKFCPKQMKVRERELQENEEDKTLVKKYDEALAKEEIAPSRKRSDAAFFCAGLFIALCAFLIIYLAWYWQSSESNLLVLKPVQTWRPQDVSAWLSDMPWAQVYAPLSAKNKIDGNMLLSMDSTSLRHFLNVTDLTHAKALLLAIDMLQKRGLKIPSTLWEYKATYPGRCLFLVYGLKDFPRTTIFYLYLYFYDDMFLPFVRTVTQSAEEAVKTSSSNVTADSISTGQWIYFFVLASLLPECLVIVFAYQMFSHHFFTPIFVIATAITYLILQIMDLISFCISRQWRVYRFVKRYVKLLISAFMFMIVWPIVPRLACDFFFYAALYISPLQALVAMLKSLRANNNPQ